MTVEDVSVPKKKPRGRVARGFFLLLSIALALFSISALGGLVVAPEKTKDIFYIAKTNVEAQVNKVAENVTGEYPTIWLEGSGGSYELDTAAKGQFVHLDVYDEIPGIVPTWGAHNGWGGDVILNMEPGQHVNIVGSGMDGEWVVVDTRNIDKFGYANQGLGLQGDMALQTCLYGEPLMRMTGLVPVDVYKNDWPRTQQSGSELPQSVDIPNVELVGNDY